MKYQALEEKEILQKLLRGILSRAATDALKSTTQREKLEAEIFIRSEYCELMCYVAHKEYVMLLRMVNNEPQIMLELKKVIKTNSRFPERKKCLRKL